MNYLQNKYNISRHFFCQSRVHDVWGTVGHWLWTECSW